VAAAVVLRVALVVVARCWFGRLTGRAAWWLL